MAQYRIELARILKSAVYLFMTAHCIVRMYTRDYTARFGFKKT